VAPWWGEEGEEVDVSETVKAKTTQNEQRDTVVDKSGTANSLVQSK
jgi:hypothetical protein